MKKAVSYALQAGYRHIDAAYCYGNEDEVGEGLREAFSSGVKREDVFITTKLWCTFHSRVEENLDLSLKSLGVDYVDLYLMHWPCPMNPKGKVFAPLEIDTIKYAYKSIRPQETILNSLNWRTALEISINPGLTFKPGLKWRSC